MKVRAFVNLPLSRSTGPCRPIDAQTRRSFTICSSRPSNATSTSRYPLHLLAACHSAWLTLSSHWTRSSQPTLAIEFQPCRPSYKLAFSWASQVASSRTRRPHPCLTAMPTPVGTAPLTVDNRARCSTCSRLQFSTVCSRKQCSKCCRDDSRRCGYTGHDSYKAHLLHAAAAPPAIAKDLFALSRPPPVHPPALPFADTSNVLLPATSALPSSEPTEPWEAATLARRSFRRPMDDSLKADWDQARALRDEKLRGIAMQRESKWKKENSLTLWCWLKVSTCLVYDSLGTLLTYRICRTESRRCANKYKAFIRSHSTASCKPRPSWSVLVCRTGAGLRRTWYDTGHGRNRIQTKCFPSSPSRYG